MASTFFGVARGAANNMGLNITVGAATGATDIELRVDTGKGSTKQDVILGVEQILRYIKSGVFDPNLTGSV